MAEKYYGISFPYRIGVKGGFVMSKATINDFTHIDESIMQIFATRPNERTMEKEVYSDIETSVFEPNDESLQNLLDFQIREALERLETRIEVQEITFTAEGNKVFAEIEYSVPEFNNNTSIVRVEVGDNNAS